MSRIFRKEGFYRCFEKLYKEVKVAVEVVTKVKSS